jgi:adenosylcobinamide kinase/adenosylcobinamide-phosphate guanylyltransferase
MSRPRKAKKNHQAQSAGSLVFVLGGAASGKSDVALRLGQCDGPKAFVATGQALDTEMATRIARHRSTRSSDWITAEVPVDLFKWAENNIDKYQSVIIDCLTLWLSNIGDSVDEKTILRQVARLLQVIRNGSAKVVMVSNELGMGLVPIGSEVRRFRDLSGKMNQLVAAEADEVYFVVSGQTLKLK